MQNTWQLRAKSAMKGKITQERLAEKLDMTQGGLGHWLSGRNQASLDDINRVADAIGVSRVWLTHGLGFKEGPGKELLDITLSGRLTDDDLNALAVMARTLLGARTAPSIVDSVLAIDPAQLISTPEAKDKAKHKAKEK